ncbi:MAG TPA: alpha-E domain-containing protein, partial [Burkholderiales bacterium]|nr:alpha-E domain-containing protein [Burkholderiales bacterium]
MLSRVGDRVFWMSRFMERAENKARILGVMSNVVLCSTPETQEQNLLAPLTITGSTKNYYALHEQLSLPALTDFMAFDADNESSIYTCIKSARDNAHEVRWQITSEMWETLNATWLEMRSFRRESSAGPDATRFFDWVKERSHLFRGVTYGTIMRGEAFHFSRLGTFLERA